MQTSSPFDQAMARPLLDEPTRKKWRIEKQASSWFEKTAAMAVILGANGHDDDNSETISFLSNDSSPIVSPSTTSNTESNITDLAFSLDSISSYNYNNNNNNSKSGERLFLHSTQRHPLEVPAPHDLWNSSCCSNSSSCSSHHPLTLELVEVDLECADTDLEILRERQAELTNIHSDMQQIHSIQHGKKQCYRISFSRYHTANNGYLSSFFLLGLL
jgi:hypothetical protein